MTSSNYDKYPAVDIPNGTGRALQSWPAILARLENALSTRTVQGARPVIAIECYAGVFVEEIVSAIATHFDQSTYIDSGEAFLSSDRIEQLVAPYLGGDDPLFGFLCPLQMHDFMSSERVVELQNRLAAASHPVFVIGPGASMIAPPGCILVYADLARWEGQARQRRHEVSNLGVTNRGLKASLQYKRSYFIDWRVCDRLKQKLLPEWDFVLDTNISHQPKMVSGPAFREALAHCVTRPFRLAPFFDPGPWGGQWMKEICDLDRDAANFAWCFDCVPEENSLFLQFGTVRFETPSINLVFAQPRSLLGEPVYGRFGPEFPIRFDFLDTMDGGNLSLQVHPETAYIQEKFGMRYTQDESYYILDSKPGAVVYLARKRGVAFEEMVANLEAAQAAGKTFDDLRFIGRYPARKHDHFLIPAGTIHGSGANCMVLEISATPFIFTFKLWDWNRLGLDGVPRPINIEHGKANIRWERDEDYAGARLVNQIDTVARGDGWREERTGLHEAEFIETRRHWFTKLIEHDTGGERRGSVNVLNLVEGRAAVVDSPDGSFDPFVVHYAETFVVPAAVGRYRIRPMQSAPQAELATIKAFVRCNA